jgi:hypothetical protein
VTLAEGERRFEKAVHHLCDVLKNGGWSRVEAEDVLVLLALEREMTAQDLGQAGVEMIDRFLARACLVEEETEEEARARVQSYFAAHPPPPGLLAELTRACGEIVQENNAASVEAHREHFGVEASKQPVQGRPGGPDSLFALRLRKGRSEEE